MVFQTFGTETQHGTHLLVLTQGELLQDGQQDGSQQPLGDRLGDRSLSRGLTTSVWVGRFASNPVVRIEFACEVGFSTLSPLAAI